MYNTTDLNILYWNSQSISNKLPETFDYLFSNNIHIALFCETWLKPKHTMYNTEYFVYRNDRMEQEHGGVAIAVRRNIVHTLLPSFNTSVIESIGVSVSTPTGNITFVSAYYTGTKSSSMLPTFKNDINTLTSIKNSYFVCGDLNSRHRFWNCLRANSSGNLLHNEMLRKLFFIHHPPTPSNFPPQTRSSPSMYNRFNFIK